jgi:hypothetical protein
MRVARELPFLTVSGTEGIDTRAVPAGLKQAYCSWHSCGGSERGAVSETRKLAAILAVDVVGYSRLMGEDEAGSLSRAPGPRKARTFGFQRPGRRKRSRSWARSTTPGAS